MSTEQGGHGGGEPGRDGEGSLPEEIPAPEQPQASHGAQAGRDGVVWDVVMPPMPPPVPPIAPPPDTLTQPPQWHPEQRWAWTPPPPPPPTPRVPKEPPRSRAAAAVLNLSGLGLGYGYLRRRWLAALSVVGAAALLVAAFWTDAAGMPWLWRTVAAAWVGTAVLTGWLLAARHRRPTGSRQRAVPVATGVVVLVALVAGYLVYGAAGRGAYHDGVAAMERGDCAEANRKFDAVTGRYELTLSRDVEAAGANRDLCAQFAAASEAEQDGDYADAVDQYSEFRSQHPDTVLVPFVHTNLKRTYNAWAQELVRDKDYEFAVEVYRDLLTETGSDEDADQVRVDLAATYMAQSGALIAEAAKLPAPTVEEIGDIIEILLIVRRDFGDTEAAGTVPRAVASTFAAANRPFARRQYCAALPALNYFAALDRALISGVFGTVRANRGEALLRCGLAQFRAGTYDGAVTELTAFVRAYPAHPAAAQARSALIAARVAAEAEVRLPLPPPLGGNSPGPISVTFYNDSSLPAHILLAGPTAHEFTLPSCGGCVQDYPSNANTCPSFDGRPSLTLNLVPGTYHMTVDHPGSQATTLADSLVVMSGFVYTECLFVTRR